MDSTRPGYLMKTGEIVSIRVGSSFFEKITFLGMYYALKGKTFSIEKQKQEVSNLEWSKYPVYVFYNKDFGYLICNSTKEFYLEKIVKMNKEIDLQKINKNIFNFLKNGLDHDLFYNICNPKNFLHFSNINSDLEKESYLTKLKRAKIGH